MFLQALRPTIYFPSRIIFFSLYILAGVVLPLSAGAAVLSLSDTSAAQGDTITVTLSVNDAPNTVNAFMLEVVYDFTTLSTRGVQGGTLVDGRYSLFSASNNKPGVVRIGGVEAESPGITKGSSGSLAYLTFEVIGTQSTTLRITNLTDDMKKPGWSSRGGLFTSISKQQDEETPTDDVPASNEETSEDDGKDSGSIIDGGDQENDGGAVVDDSSGNDKNDEDVKRWSGGGFFFPSDGTTDAEGADDKLNIPETPDAREQGADPLDRLRDGLGTGSGRKDSMDSLLNRLPGSPEKQGGEADSRSVLGKINIQSKGLFSQKDPAKSSRLTGQRTSQNSDTGNLSQQISLLQKQQQRVETILWLQLACLMMQVIILLILLILLVKNLKNKNG